MAASSFVVMQSVAGLQNLSMELAKLYHINHVLDTLL
jgi:hypothetical protein